MQGQDAYVCIDHSPDCQSVTLPDAHDRVGERHRHRLGHWRGAVWRDRLGGRQTATSGTDGRYTLSDIALGATNVTVKHQGHRNISQRVTVVAGTTTSNVAIMPAIVSGFAGTWTGSWTNTTFGSTGTTTMTVTPDTPAETMSITFDMNGGVFGAGDPPAETQTIPYTTTGGGYTGTSAFFGKVTLSGTPTGMLTGTVTEIPGGTISKVDLTGMITPQTLTGTAVITFATGATANGTMTLTKQSGLTTSAFVAQRLLVHLHELYAMGSAWVPSAN